MAKKRSKKKWIIIAVIAVIVILAVLGYIRLRSNLENLTKTTYAIAEVERGNVEVKVKGAGSVEPLVDETIYSSFSGSVEEVFAEDGDVVKADDVIAVFKSDAMQSEKEALEQQISEIDKAIGMMRITTGSSAVYSPVEGVIKIMHAEQGDSVDVVVDEFGSLCVICPDELMQTRLSANGAVKAGDAVKVTIGEKTANGFVYAVKDSEMTVRFQDDDFMVGESALATTESGAQLGSGSVEIANPVYVIANGGIIDGINETVGDKVKVRTKLFELEGEILSPDLYSQIEQRKELEQDLADLNEDIEALAVRAGTDGVIFGLTLNKDQSVQPGTPLFTVKSNRQIKLEVEIDEIDIVNIELGQEAVIEFEALPDKTFTATVIKINPVGVSVNNVTNYTITLELEPAEEIMLGMSADVEIVSQRVENALLIPIEAIQIINGEKYVVFEEDIDESQDYTVATHKIETGITDGVMIEVISGLIEGDRIAVPQVRELTSQELQQQMMMRGSRTDSEE